jgi:hypothetical protein
MMSETRLVAMGLSLSVTGLGVKPAKSPRRTRLGHGQQTLIAAGTTPSFAGTVEAAIGESPEFASENDLNLYQGFP